MALDHYVSQVHLRNFYAPALGELMYATRKSDLKSFKCNSAAVCRIEEGNTNAFLRNDRAVEDFLKGIEPKYNAAIKKLRDHAIDREAIYTIAGFVAYVSSCAPAAMRSLSNPLKAVVEAEAEILDRKGLLPKAPESLGAKSATELLRDGIAKVSVDKKYPQALGIASITATLSALGNSFWEVLRNGAENSPFFTSDFPIAFEKADRNGRVNKLVPLAPDLAVRIIPNLEMLGKEDDLTFSKFTHEHKTTSEKETASANRLIVQSAEDTVFYCTQNVWTEAFVAKNRDFRTDTVVERVPMGKGVGLISQQQIVAYRQER